MLLIPSIKKPTAALFAASLENTCAGVNSPADQTDHGSGYQTHQNTLDRCYGFLWKQLTSEQPELNMTKETGLAAASMEPPSYSAADAAEDREDHNGDQAGYCGIFDTAGDHAADVGWLCHF